MKNLRRCVRDAGRLLRRAFCDWVQSIEVPDQLEPYHFGDNCLFLNFNYTDTLERRFLVNPQLDYHIHGEMSDPDSIIYGHASHPQQPEELLRKLGGRFYGLYCVEDALFETDKHCQDQIHLLCMALALMGVQPADFRQVYVVGHSMAPVDAEYFAFLTEITQLPTHQPEDTQELSEMDPLEALHQRLQYAIQTVGYQQNAPTPESIQAIERQYWIEQAQRDQCLEQEFTKLLRKSGRPFSSGKGNVRIRTESAPWHISCYTDRDRQWAERLMKVLGNTQYTLYDSIEACLEPFLT